MIQDFDPAVQRMMLAEEQEACIRGARAAHSGLDIADNPYPEMSDYWGAWRSGWRRPGMYIGDSENGA